MSHTTEKKFAQKGGIYLRFIDIPQLLTNKTNYKIDVGFKYFSKTIQQFIDEDGLILIPEFQRGHVWTEEQQEKYVEYICYSAN